MLLYCVFNAFLLNWKLSFLIMYLDSKFCLD